MYTSMIKHDHMRILFPLRLPSFGFSPPEALNLKPLKEEIFNPKALHKTPAGLAALSP